MKDLKWDWPTSQSSAMPVQIKNSAPGFVNSAATHLPKLANAHQRSSLSHSESRHPTCADGMSASGEQNKSARGVGRVSF